MAFIRYNVTVRKELANTTIMSPKPNELANPFHGINENELKLLCFLAYFGDDSKNKNDSLFQKKYHVTKQLYDRMLYKLNQLKYTQVKTHVAQEWHLEINSFLRNSRPDWLLDFIGMRGCTHSEMADYLWQLSICLDNGELEKAEALKRPYSTVMSKVISIYPYLMHQIERSEKYIQLLKPEDLPILKEDELNDAFERGELRERILDLMLQHLHAKLPSHRVLADCLSFYRYLVSGAPMKIESSVSSWGFIYEAMKAMYAQDFEKAFEKFQMGLIAKKLTKNECFGFPIVDFFYCICLLKLKDSGHPHVVNAIKEFTSSSPVKYKHQQFPARLLACYVDDTEEHIQQYLSQRVRNNLNIDQHHVTCVFALLLFKHFNIPLEKTDNLNNLVAKPAILRYELSPYVPIGRKENEQMQHLYGPSPLMHTLKKISLWESVLQAVNTQIQEKDQPKEKRIVYYLVGPNVATIMEETKQPDGTWAAGSLISEKMLMSGVLESMDEKDSKVAMRMSTGKESVTEILVSGMDGTGRLFTGSPYNKVKVPAKIKHEPPYLDIHGKGCEITISSNVQTDEKGMVKKHTVCQDKDESYSLISVNAIQRDVLQRVLQQQVFPASAAMALREMADKIKGILEIRHNILDKISTPTMSGNGTLSVRLIPENNEYTFKILAAPLEKGAERLPPAEGSEVIYDEVDGQMVCIKRDLDQEQANLEYLTEFLEQTICAEFTTYNEGSVSTAENLLKLLVMAYENPNRVFCEWPEGQRLKFKGDIQGGDISVTVKTGIDWFEVEGEVNVSKKMLKPKEVLEMYKKSEYEGFIKIGEDEYMRMSDTIRKHLQALENMPVSTHTNLVSKYQVGPLAAALEGIRTNGDKGYETFLRQMREAYASDPQLPVGLLATLRPYQLEGYKWMKKMDAWGAGVCLADDMGLGKTLQALSFILSKAKEGASLVVAPKSVIPNWIAEAKRFTPILNMYNLNKGGDHKRYIKNAKEFDVIVCTYGKLNSLRSELTEREWNVICLDEAHLIKNRETNMSRTAMQLKAKSRLALTGTPLQNHLGELWNLFQFINPGSLGPYRAFHAKYIAPKADPEYREVLKEHTAPFILRRTKEEVLDDLPEKMQQVRYVELTPHEEEAYESMRSLIELKFKKEKTKEEKAEMKNIHIHFLAELTKLRLAACSMQLIDSRWGETSSKITELLKILEALMRNPENQIIVFSQFTSYFDIIKVHLKRMGWDWLYLDGSTPMGKRQDQVMRFQNGECQLFLCSLKAGGLGINLTAANYVILLDPWWNPAIENQAMDRAHRIGQQRCVSVIRLISEHTIEEKVLRLHEQKKELYDDILDGTNQTYKLTYEDMLDMVSPF